MNTSKKYLVSILFFVFLILPNVGSAQTAAEIQAIQAQISDLLQKIQQLQAQLAQLQTGTAPSTPTTPAGWCYNFSVNLKYKNQGAEVEALQFALEQQGFAVSQSEKTAKYFGESTASAVTGFQEKYKSEILKVYGLQYGTGFVGSTTRAKLNALFQCAATITPPISISCNYNQDCDAPNETVQTCPYDCLLYADTPTIVLIAIPPSIKKGGSSGLSWTSVNTTSCIWTEGLSLRVPTTGYNVVSPTQTTVYTLQCTGTDNSRVTKSVTVEVSEESVPPITVMTPNGGETFKQGGKITISWATNNLASKIVSINLLKAGKLYKTITGASQSEVTQLGYYTWTVPTSIEVGSDYAVEVADYYDSSVKDASNGYFSIVSAKAPTITLTVYPEAIPKGGSATLAWYVYNADSCSWISPQSEKITNFSGTKIVSPDETKTYAMKCTGLGGISEKSVTLEVSKETPKITVTYPNGGEQFSRGQNMVITWSANNFPDNNINIKLLKAGVDYKTIVSSLAIPLKTGPGVYIWQVPADLPYASDYTIKISDSNNNNITDTSDAAFNVVEVKKPVLYLTAFPETISLGEKSILAWMATNASSCAWTSGLSGATTIAGAKTVQPIQTTDYTMECTGNGGSVKDTAWVTVTAGVPAITVTAPNGGESIPTGPNNYKITYSVANYNQLISPTVRLELLHNGILLGSITVVQVYSGSEWWNFSWAPGNYHDIYGNYKNAGAGSGFRIRATLFSNGAIVSRDESDSSFSIIEQIIPKFSIKVLSPNGGEKWEIGKTYKVSWKFEPEGIMPNVSISVDLYKGDQLIYGGSVGTGVTFADFTVKESHLIVLGDNDYRIKVIESNNPTNYDFSDAPFSIVAVGTCASWNDVIAAYNAYTSGTKTWSEFVNTYMNYSTNPCTGCVNSGKVNEVYNKYLSGQATWQDVINAYNQYCVETPAYTISPSSAFKQINQTQQFIGRYDPDGSGPQVSQDKTTSASWSSSALSIATISSSGLATCLKQGAVNINSTYSGISATSAALTCLCPTLSAPSLVSPANGANLGIAPQTPSFSWTDISGEQKYWVDVSTNNFATWDNMSVPANQTSATWKTSLGSGTYQWRVFADNILGCPGIHSSARSFVISSTPCIQVITPAQNPQTGECKNFPTPCDVPSGWIKVNQCPTSITVISPNGGEQWQIGTTQRISWTSPKISQINIDLYCNNAQYPIAYIYDNTIVTRGYYDWNITSTYYPVSTNCKIRIRDHFDSTVFDESNNYFSIVTIPVTPSITSVSPTSGAANDTITIYGKNLINTDPSGNINPSGIYIEFLRNGVQTGTINGPIYTQADGLSLRFQLSGIFVANSQVGTYQIRAVNANGKSNAVDFTILGSTPSITVLSPNGGERWVRGNTYSIFWNSTGITSADKITISVTDYSNPSSLVSYDLAYNIAGNLGAYNWTISSNFNLGDKYKIKVESCIPGKCYSDLSDNYFSIVVAGTCPTWSEVINKYNQYVAGTATWSEVISVYNSYASCNTVTSYPLTVAKSGAGSGRIVSNPSGINCDSTCSTHSAFFTSGTGVVLTATPEIGSTFAGWTGNCSGSNTNVVVTMNSNKTCTATFNLVSEAFNFSLAINPSSDSTTLPTSGSTYLWTTLQFTLLSGSSQTVVFSVSNLPTGVTATQPSSCTTSCSRSTAFTISSSAAIGNHIITFTGTGGGLTKTATYALTIKAPTVVCTTWSEVINKYNQYVAGTASWSDVISVYNSYASCNTVSSYPLTVTKSGAGSGTVTGSGINCGSTCNVFVSSGSSVTLYANPLSGSTFAGWGGACSGTGSCVVSMTSSKSVSATFNIAPVFYNLTVSKSGTGSGTVTSSPSGINCGSTCSASYTSGTAITLTASPVNSTVGWGAGCAVSGNNCTLTMTANKSIAVVFTAIAITCPTWNDVINAYNDYTAGKISWSAYVDVYNRYVSCSSSSLSFDQLASVLNAVQQILNQMLQSLKGL